MKIGVASFFAPRSADKGIGGRPSHKIKQYILEQTLTSEADATGLGSGVADAHLATFSDIVEYDARNLQETSDTHLLDMFQRADRTLTDTPQRNGNSDRLSFGS